MRIYRFARLFLPTLFFSAQLSGAELSEEQVAQVEALIETKRQEIREEILSELELMHQQGCVDSSSMASNQETPTQSLGLDEMDAASANVPFKSHEYAASDDFGFNGFKVEGATDKSRATISFGQEVSQPGPPGEPIEFSRTAVTISAPLDKNNSEFTNISTLDGLANSFKFSYSLFKVFGSSPSFRNGSATFKNENDWFYGMTASLGYEEFEFYLREDLAKRDDEKLPWSIEISGGFAPGNSNSNYSLGLAYQDSYKVAELKTICPPALSQTAVDCITGSFDSPEHREKALAFFQARSQLQVLSGTSRARDIGVSFRLTHDFKNDETGIDLPMYVIRDKEGSLNGGFRVGWTDTDDLSFGVFVGSGFKWLDY